MPAIKKAPLPKISDDDLAQQRLLTAAAITGPLPFEVPPAPANDDGLPILLGYQGRWISDTADVKVAEKSRRIGLTWAEAFDCVTIAGAKRSAGGTNCFYIGYNFEMAREYIAACAMWAKHLQQAVTAASGEFLFRDSDEDGETREIKAFRITFASGYSIIALPSRPRSLRGMQGVVILDEAAFHDDLGGMLKAAMALLMWGGKVRIISTHDGTANTFNELVQDCRAKRKPYSLHKIDIDDALADGLYKRICTSTGVTWSTEAEAIWRAGLIANYAPNDQEELFCIPSEGGGAYFPLSMLEGAANDNAMPVIRLERDAAFGLKSDLDRARLTKLWIDVELAPRLLKLNQDDPSSIGGDFARSGDVSARWVFQTDRQNRRRTSLVIELRNVPFTDQEMIDAALHELLPRWTASKYDATGNGAYLAERMQQLFGVDRVEAVKFTAAWYIENFPRLRAAIEDRTADLPNDRDIFADFRLVTLSQGVPKVPESKRTTEKGGKRGQRHGDTAIAAVLAYAASRAEAFEVGYQAPASRRRDVYEPRLEGGGGAVAMRHNNEDEFTAARPRETF
jgi:phage FluMu gp28-like protein